MSRGSRVTSRMAQRPSRFSFSRRLAQPHGLPSQADTRSSVTPAMLNASDTMSPSPPVLASLPWVLQFRFGGLSASSGYTQPQQEHCHLPDSFC